MDELKIVSDSQLYNIAEFLLLTNNNISITIFPYVNQKDIVERLNTLLDDRTFTVQPHCSTYGIVRETNSKAKLNKLLYKIRLIKNSTYCKDFVAYKLRKHLPGSTNSSKTPR